MGSPVVPLGLKTPHAAGEVFLLGCFPPNLAISRKKVKTSKQILKTMVNQTNKQTFGFPLVGEVCNLAGVECPINSKVYHKCPYTYRRIYLTYTIDVAIIIAMINTNKRTNWREKNHINP